MPALDPAMPEPTLWVSARPTYADDRPGLVDYEGVERVALALLRYRWTVATHVVQREDGRWEVRAAFAPPPEADRRANRAMRRILIALGFSHGTLSNGRTGTFTSDWQVSPALTHPMGRIR